MRSSTALSLPPQLIFSDIDGNSNGVKLIILIKDQNQLAVEKKNDRLNVLVSPNVRNDLYTFSVVPSILF